MTIYNIIKRFDNGYKLALIPYGAESPMENHQGGEIATDTESKTFYAWEVFAVAYGIDSLVKACHSYFQAYKIPN